MKLLISPVNESEALEAIAGKADIIDVKNPREGALGANYPWVISRIRQLAPKDIEVSCTIGEAPNLPATMSLAALGAATTGVNYIKVGLWGLKTTEEAVSLLQSISKAVIESHPAINVVATGYADAERVSTVNPMFIPEIAYKANADFAMLDTAIKDGKSLFTFLDKDQLKTFISKARDFGLKTALAGSLSKDDLVTIKELEPDVVGLRGAACANGDRVNGQIIREKVLEIASVLNANGKQSHT